MPEVHSIPSRLIYMSAILDILRAAGGSLKSKDVYNEIMKSGLAQDRDINHVQKSGEIRFLKEVRFARKELAEAGLLTSVTYGVWSLSTLGWSTCLTPESARALIRNRRHDTSSPDTRTKAKSPNSAINLAYSPAPSTWRKLVERDQSGKSWTYIMRYGKTDIWKIGYSSDVNARLVEINTHVPHEATGHLWLHYARYPWPNAETAYGMEQRLLKVLSSARTFGERVRCPENVLLAAWREAIVTYNIIN